MKELTASQWYEPDTVSYWHGENGPNTLQIKTMTVMYYSIAFRGEIIACCNLGVACYRIRHAQLHHSTIKPTLCNLYTYMLKLAWRMDSHLWLKQPLLLYSLLGWPFLWLILL